MRLGIMLSVAAPAFWATGADGLADEHRVPQRTGPARRRRECEQDRSAMRRNVDAYSYGKEGF